MTVWMVCFVLYDKCEIIEGHLSGFLPLPHPNNEFTIDKVLRLLACPASIPCSSVGCEDLINDRGLWFPTQLYSSYLWPARQTTEWGVHQQQINGMHRVKQCRPTDARPLYPPTHLCLEGPCFRYLWSEKYQHGIVLHSLCLFFFFSHIKYIFCTEVLTQEKCLFW